MKSRAQLWQWLHHSEARTTDGELVDEALYKRVVNAEMKNSEALAASIPGTTKRLTVARQLLDELVTQDDFVDFLTTIAYKHLSSETAQ